MTHDRRKTPSSQALSEREERGAYLAFPKARSILEPLYGQFSVHILCDAPGSFAGAFYNHILRNKRDITNQDSAAERPDQIWVSDITCYKLKGKNYHIAVILARFFRKVIAHRISAVASAKLIAAAFRQGYADRSPSLTPCRNAVILSNQKNIPLGLARSHRTPAA